MTDDNKENMEVSQPAEIDAAILFQAIQGPAESFMGAMHRNTLEATEQRFHFEKEAATLRYDLTKKALAPFIWSALGFLIAVLAYLVYCVTIDRLDYVEGTLNSIMTFVVGMLTGVGGSNLIKLLASRR